jgi:hypothetical protein
MSDSRQSQAKWCVTQRRTSRSRSTGGAVCVEVSMWLESLIVVRSGVVHPCLTYCVRLMEWLGVFGAHPVALQREADPPPFWVFLGSHPECLMPTRRADAPKVNKALRRWMASRSDPRRFTTNRTNRTQRTSLAGLLCIRIHGFAVIDPRRSYQSSTIRPLLGGRQVVILKLPICVSEWIKLEFECV